MNQTQKIEQLGYDVYDKIGKPVNENVVRAMLESMSIRTIDAKQDYGINDLQDLAKLVYNQITSPSFLASLIIFKCP